MSEKRGIILGPWVGEFGWELFSWHAYCRAISKSYDFVVAISRPGNDLLYSDFSDIYVPFEPPTGGIVDSHSNSAVTDFNITEFIKTVLPPDILQMYRWNWLPPTKIGSPPYDHWRTAVNVANFNDVIPQYKILRGELPKNLDHNIDIVIHARDRDIRKVDNWSTENWSSLVTKMSKYNIASIGTSSSSLHIDGTVDLRDMSLKHTCGILRHARCAVGPSSGPLHLASLTGCPQVIWTSNPNQNFSRYKYCWNPFEADVSMFMGPDPKPNDIVELIKKYV